MEMLIKSLNCNGFAHTLSNDTFEERLEKILNHVSKEVYQNTYVPLSVLGLQEVIVGKKCRYLKQIQNRFPDFELILPADFSDIHYKSAINVLLIRKSLIKNYEILKLFQEESYLYNYVVLNTTLGTTLRLLNLHMPQRAVFDNRPKWYIENRIELNEKLWDAALEIVDKYKDTEYLVVFGDFNAGNSDNHVVKMKFQYNMISLARENETTFFNEECGIRAQTDNIYVSLKTVADKKNTIRSAIIDRSTYDSKLSDHSVLCTWFSLPEAI